MKRSISKFGTRVAAFAAFALMMAAVNPRGALAQPAPATIHGHVNNAAGMAIHGGEVKLTTEKTVDPKTRKYQYTFPIGDTGDFKGTGIAPGDYVAIVFQESKSIDFQDVKLAAGDDKVMNFDMSRKEYIDKMTPEEKTALEEYKKKNAEIVAGNAKISNLNALLTQARTDTKAGNFDSAIKAMTDATAAKPDESILWVTMGDAQLGAADAAAKAARAAKTNPMDAAIQQKYTDAAASYKKGVDLNAASKKPSPETAAAAYNQMGQALGKMGNAKDASDAYESAAKAMPANAGMYYFNEAATLFNSGKSDEAAVAADKAIAADPNKADAYYIKGQALISKASVDEKTQKVTAPPGCVEAYNKYLQLAPTGPRAEEVKQILLGIGEKVQSVYKAPPKSKK